MEQTSAKILFSEIRNAFSQNGKVLAVFIICALNLSCIKYFGDIDFVIALLNDLHFSKAAAGIEKWFLTGDVELRRLFYWVLILDFFYLLVPLLVIVIFFRDNVKKFGLAFRMEKGSWKIYLAFMAVMLPLVIFMSSTKSFQAKYPFYDIPHSTPLWPKFFMWELLYISQFFCLEFFFRGFILQGLKPAIGIYSIFAMMIPYCMIHFGKPFPETIAAIIAGIILGFLSYYNRSIWLGFFLHITVAISMDFSALLREGYFG